VNVTLIGDSASALIFSDLKNERAFQPKSSLTRPQAQALLERYVESGERDSTIEWKEANVPFVKIKGKGCLGSALLFAVLAVAAWSLCLSS
jgi:hypothetical protein